ncbi:MULTISPECIES: DUF881 domain-containing protein [Clostridium]|uniref:DUF881 domain-containing protein n=1 Tax=Clostridium cibarium TaxID=2762247 RepID=A0ABR8PPG0_9CLOT|nr:MULTISPECIES: DUF881 domain-containing protein [Clostridium]MBD7910058.1 DUF881 domain-containing protein [Clostridium cibarium]
MNNKRAKVIVFISTIVVGFLIAGNFSFEGFDSSFPLNAKEYQNAIETKNNLLKEVGSLKSDNQEIKEKIDKYNNNDVNYDKILSDMKAQVRDYGMLTGLNEATGPGIVVVINDGIIDNSADSQEDADRKTLHDADMFSLLNELKSAGAEAIAINDHRISPLTALTCKYAFLEFEDGDMVSAPFNIYAIGDPESMKTLLLQEGSYLKRLKIRGLSVNLDVKDNITLKAANISEMKYAEEYIKKNK